MSGKQVSPNSWTLLSKLTPPSLSSCPDNGMKAVGGPGAPVALHCNCQTPHDQCMGHLMGMDEEIPTKHFGNIVGEIMRVSNNFLSELIYEPKCNRKQSFQIVSQVHVIRKRSRPTGSSQMTWKDGLKATRIPFEEHRVQWHYGCQRYPQRHPKCVIVYHLVHLRPIFLVIVLRSAIDCEKCTLQVIALTEMTHLMFKLAGDEMISLSVYPNLTLPRPVECGQHTFQMNKGEEVIWNYCVGNKHWAPGTLWYSWSWPRRVFRDFMKTLQGDHELTSWPHKYDYTCIFVKNFVIYHEVFVHNHEVEVPGTRCVSSWYHIVSSL